MSNHYSDLQTVTTEEQPKYYISGPRDPSTDLPQPVPYSDKIATKIRTHEGQKPMQLPEYEQSSKPEHSDKRHKRICGLTQRTFWIVFAILAIVIIAAAVGGGVGGSSNKDKQVAVESTTTSSVPMSLSTTTPTSSSSSSPLSSSVTISTTTIVGPSQTLLSDCPSSNNTIYFAPSTSQVFRKFCGNSLLSAKGTQNCVNQQAASLDACIGLCAAYNVQYSADIASSAKSVCNSVCWRATIVDDDYPGQCYGFTTFNGSGTFTFGYDSRCNSAALISQ